MRIAHFFGIDGSGKTTVAKACVTELGNRGIDAKYVYAQHEPRLLAPLKWFARRTLLRGASPTTDYAAYASRKSEVGRRHGAIAVAYAVVWIVDYLVSTHWRLLRYRLTDRTLVVDRYYPDIAVNIADSIGLDSRGLNRLLRVLGTLFPRAAVSIWLDVPEDVAFSRKTDVPSVLQLRSRRARYNEIADGLRAIKMDGTRPITELVNSCSSVIR